MDIRKRLAELYTQNLEEEKKYISYLGDITKAQKHVKSHFWFINEENGLYHSFLNPNVIQAKQCFYLCGRIDEYLVQTYDSDILHWGMNRICLTLLSDCTPLVQRYAQLADSKFASVIKKAQIIYMMQCAIKDDMDELDRQITLLEKKVEFKTHKWNIPDLQFFKGLRNGDIDMMEEALATFVSKKHHNYRNKYGGIFKDLLSYPAVGYAKLAWLKGFEVHVDSPLVPKELLPHRPNAEYVDSYEFLKELNE